MKTIIAGTRGCHDMEALFIALNNCGWAPSVVISGTAMGVDRLGEDWARKNDIPLEQYPADWNRFGKSAGYKRNQIMAEHADALLAIWDGKSRGTKHMIDIATKIGLRVHVHFISLG